MIRLFLFFSLPADTFVTWNLEGRLLFQFACPY